MQAGSPRQNWSNLNNSMFQEGIFEGPQSANSAGAGLRASAEIAACRCIISARVFDGRHGASANLPGYHRVHWQRHLTLGDGFWRSRPSV